MDRQLGDAVSAALTIAMSERRRGILVTRHGRNSFTVTPSEAVPFGLTRELQDW